MANTRNINKKGRATMKNSIRIVSVVLAIVMSFAAVQAFGGMEIKKGAEGPDVELLLDVVSGCVLSLHDDSKDGITLCRDNGVEGCTESDDNVANACDRSNCSVEDVITILGIGPAFYWENALTLQIDEYTCLPEAAVDGKVVETGETSTIPQPGPGEYVKIGYYPSQDGEDLIALWVIVGPKDKASAVLLRDQETLDVLWKSVGNNTGTNSEE
jgi:hypothetical protein